MKKKKKEEILEEKNQPDNIEQEISDEEISIGEEDSITPDERIRELEERNQELNDRVLRRAAEFENYKRRTDAEKEMLFKYAAEPFIVKILQIYDDLQRSLSHIDNDNIDSLRDGYRMIADKFTQILEEQGVKKIDTSSKEFNYEYHEALLQQPSNDIPENIIIEEIEPGYIYKDKVIKHAKVIVSQGTEENKEKQEVDKEKTAEE